MIIAKLQGGLGNQMFQYAFGRALAVKNDVPLKLDISMFSTYKWHQCMIDKLNISAPFANNSEIRRFSLHRRRPNWPLKILNPLLHDPKKYVTESSFYFDPGLLEVKPPCLVDGYWLSEKYFLDIEDTIRTEFTIRGESNEYTKRMEEKIQSAEHPVMVHVRRADYATAFSHIHGTLSSEYYDRAFAHMNEKVPNASYFIFSDEPEWAREHVRPPSTSLEYIGQGAAWNYLDLYLMSLCEHFVLANSTFGWWGAWLSKNYRHNITVMPKYMTNKMDVRDLAHQSWIVLDDTEWSARKNLVAA
ncbi:alpha-1,2-fucosyltransferase [Candidatus Parcubacteria bacterium]|nr:MAG: alpha-1,2-fucosyltransferase [Candidatus Parcubacteria bacterium]